MKKTEKRIPLKNSISFRLSFRFMLIVASIVLLLSFGFVFLLRYSATNQQKRLLYGSTESLKRSYLGTDEFVPELMSIPYFLSFTIYDSETKTTLFTNDPFIPNLPVTNGKAKKYFKKDYYADGNMNILYNSILIENTCIVIQTAMDIDRDSAKQMINEIPKLALISFLPILLISFLLSLLITKKTIRPVEKITDSAAEMSSTNLETLLPVSNKNDELDYLAKTFNKLFENLKADFEQERNFTSNVSHELKTPVAGILGQANLLKRWGKDDPKQLEQSLNMIIAETESMNSIITNLLQISKLEAGKEKIFQEELNIAILFDRLKKEFSVINSDVEINIKCSEDFIFITDIELLHQVLTALISNSIKFHKKDSGTNCCIELSAEHFENKIIITESDNGPGISEEVMPHIFERFYRGDASHNRKAGGAGLGLSISSSIVTALKGTIEAGNKTNGTGAVFSLTFPV